jgi:hypothetical protein
VSPACAREPAAVPTGHLVPWVRSYKRAACDICPPLSPLPFTSGKPSAAGPLFRPPPFFLGRPPHHSYFTVRRSKGGTTLRGSSRTCRNHLYLVGAPPHRSRAAAGALSSVSRYQSGSRPLFFFTERSSHLPGHAGPLRGRHRPLHHSSSPDRRRASVRVASRVTVRFRFELDCVVLPGECAQHQ